MYHGVVPSPDFSISAGHLSARQFEQHLLYFKKNFSVLPSAELFNLYRQGIIPKKPAIAITFDDGYENNHTYAFSLLKKHKLPGTFFATTQCLDKSESFLWYDKLFFIKNKQNFLSLDLTAAEIDPAKKKVLTTCKSNDDFIDCFKLLNTPEKESVLKIIKTKINYEKEITAAPGELWKVMNREQLAEIADYPGMEIGSHTHTHPNLSNIDLKDAEHELAISKQLLETAIGKPVTSIAYPDGSYSERVKELSLKTGYTDLFAAHYLLSSDIADKHILPRFCVSCTTTAESNLFRITAAFNQSGF